MIIETGDMWSIYGKTNLFCITTNTTVKKDGRLVMGRGMALQARQKLPEIDLLLGQSIRRHNNSEYGLRVEYYHPGKCYIGAFQVKYFWGDKADLHLIENATETLIKATKHAIFQTRVDLNYPGIGNGGLAEAEVYPIISKLPDCVHVWKYA